MRYLVFFFVIIFLLILPCIINASQINYIYYIKLEVKTLDSAFANSKLTMELANDEYRIDDFKLFRIVGKAKGKKKLNIASVAVHNGISDLLMKYGLKSVKSNKYVLNSIIKDEIIVKYEGVIKYPYKILDQGYHKDKNFYAVDLEIFFSPIEFPDKWSYLYFKKTISDTFNKFLSIF